MNNPPTIDAGRWNIVGLLGIVVVLVFMFGMIWVIWQGGYHCGYSDARAEMRIQSEAQR
jgi:hypothetical protein